MPAATAWRDCTHELGPLPDEGWHLVVAELLEVPAPGPGLRQRQSEVAREIAGRKLAELGAVEARIGRHPRGYPLWPDGHAGSIAHSGRFVAAVVAPNRGARLGIDLEDPLRLDCDMWPNVFTADERRRLVGVSDASRQRILAAVIFGAKEAAYKALFPHHGEVAGFLESTVALDFSGADARLVVTAGANHTATGQWLRWRDHVVVVCAD